MFEIQLLPPTELGPAGERLGRIVIGDFTERFPCYPFGGYSLEEVPKQWKQQLGKLVNGSEAVALQTDPRFAWIIYREDRSCYIQQKLSLDESFQDILPRETESDGHAVSEWATSIDDIIRFLI